MIPSAAITAYLERPLGSHRWVKSLSAGDLEVALQALDPKPQLNPKLRLHQRACFLLGVAYPRLCFFLDMGVGKSLLTLELLRYWFQTGRIKRALIFVTSDKAFHTWEKQLKEFEIDLPLIALAGSSKEKWAQLEQLDRGLVLVSYPGAVAMTCNRVKGKKKVELKLDKKLAARLAKWGDALVLDESTRVGSYKSLGFSLVSQLRKTASVSYALAGRPFGRDPTMLWAQCFLIDGGETLGETLGMFRAAFFSEQPCHWDPRGYAKDYAFKQTMKPQLARMVQHRSITYSADECIELPKVTKIKEVVPFPTEARAYYESALEEVIAAKGNLREMKNAFIRMRQISSGFIGLKNDETGERAEIELLENPKLERLLELVDDLPEGRKLTVFHDFLWTGAKIQEALTARNIGSMRLWSGTKDPTAEQVRFSTDPKCEVAIIQSQTGAFSIDGLQKVSSYLVFVESPLGIVAREQAERRINRQGQPHPVFQIDLVMAKSVDERILALHEEGRSFFDAVLKNPGLLRGK